MNLDIIVVNYKSSECLLKCLESIYASSGSVTPNVIVYDNGCDPDDDLVEARFPQVLYNRNEKNIGFAAAVNKGLLQSVTSYVMLLNPDTYLEDSFLETVTSYLEANGRIGVLGPRILNGDGTVQGSARSFPTPLTGFFGRTSLLSRLLPNNRITCKNILTCSSAFLDEAMPVDWVSGACMVIRREALEEVGLLDERFFMYWEDADWCRSMGLSGWKVVYFPKASVTHHVGQSSRKRRYKSLLNFHWSAYLLFEKYSRWPVSCLNPIVFLTLCMSFYIKAAALFFREMLMATDQGR